MNTETVTDKVEMAERLLRELRGIGWKFALGANGQPTVKPTEELPMSPELLTYL